MIIADATQVFGGRALTVTGMGKYIENVSALLVLYFHSVRHLWSLTNFYTRSHLRTNVLCQALTDWMLSRFGMGDTSTTEPQASMRVSVILFLALVQPLGLLRIGPWKALSANLLAFASHSPRWCGRCIG